MKHTQHTEIMKKGKHMDKNLSGDLESFITEQPVYRVATVRYSIAGNCELNKTALA
jgi:hypothetical protein